MMIPFRSLMGFLALIATAWADAPDLSPVRFQPAPDHAPVVLATEGIGHAAVVVHSRGTRDLAPMVKELREVFLATTGAELPQIRPEAAATHQGVLIHIGESAAAAEQGLVGKAMPVEGFAIKTAPGAIFIVGHDEEAIDGVKGACSSGTAWGVAEFMERYLGVRWYWPTELDGRSIESRPTLPVPPVFLTDAPRFRERRYYPPFNHLGSYGRHRVAGLTRTLRAGSSWPVQIAVHQPARWGENETYRKERPEMFQLDRDGTRNFSMLDYAHPLTLRTYLEEIADYVENGTPKSFIKGKAVTVSPADFAFNSYSPEARALWDDEGGRYGQASRIMADFVKRLGTALRERHPEMKVIFLPYKNYTLAPKGYRFPGNVYIQLCGMPGLACYKEPSVREAEQANIDAWIEISGHPIINWHYSCWPADRTLAPFQYPNVIQAFYQANRDKTRGTFINGTDTDEWLRFAFSLHTWLKVLWNPDFPVEAAKDAFCRRMFGAAAPSAKKILDLQIRGWEESRWPQGTLTAQAIYSVSYPRETLEAFRKLFARAREEAAGDELSLRRLAYLEKPFGPFEAEFARVVDGRGLQEMTTMKVMENPVIDGRLDDAVWKAATPVELRKKGKGDTDEAPVYPTRVSSVWTMDGVSFGFHMVEPDARALKTEANARDHPMTWHDDCVEVFLSIGEGEAGGLFQIIATSLGTIQDLRNGDMAVDLNGVKTASFLGDGFWSCEIFIPYSDLAYQKKSAGGDRWGLQLTRHRTAARGSAKTGGRENQKLNAGSGGYNNNLSDFSSLRFRE